MPAEEFPSFSYAFQPIVDTEAGRIFAHEALVRGPKGESAQRVLDAVDALAIHRFDRIARIAAVRLAGKLGLPGLLSLNFLPQALDSVPDAVDSMLEVAAEVGIPSRQLMLEVTEGEVIADIVRFSERLNHFRAQGIRLAIDDFGAGHAGLNLLADFQPDIVKLDMNLVRGISTHGPRQAIARAVIQVCDDLGIEVIVEGVETPAEHRWFERLGVRLYQGYLFGRPEFESISGRMPEESRMAG